MTIMPRYNFLPGTEITLFERPMIVTGTNDHGYRVAGRDDGIITTLPFGALVEQLKLPGARLDTSLPATGGRLKQRLGGFSTSEALSADQRETGRFHLALCQAVLAWRTAIRAEHRDPSLDLSERMLDRPEARRFIAAVGERIFGKKILVNPARGGTTRAHFMYRGRTLMKYFRVFENLEPDESPMDALVTLDHLRGNRTDKICGRVRELMTEAWERIGFDVKCTSLANVRKFLEARIREENRKRGPNELSEPVVPADRTLREHRDGLLTPTEYLIATKGLRHARNKRGRGSTDLRALVIGEMVEIDECKISLVMAAKTGGFWERMKDAPGAASSESRHGCRSFYGETGARDN